jgi:hypothetical protein
MTAISSDLDIGSSKTVSKTNDFDVQGHDEVTSVDTLSINNDGVFPSRWFLGRTVLDVAKESGSSLTISSWVALAHESVVSVVRRQQCNIVYAKPLIKVVASVAASQNLRPEDGTRYGRNADG